jgi:O-antigen ligase
MVIIIALPSAFDGLITFPENTVRFLLISIFSLIWIISHFKTKLDFPSKSIILLLTTYYLYNLISSFWSLNPSNSIIEGQKIGLGILTILIFNSILKVEKKYISFLKSYLLFSLALITSLSYDLITMEQYSLNGLYEINSFFIHKNILASFLFLSLAITCLSIIKLKDKWKVFSILITLLLFSILIIIFNRTTYIALFVSAFIFLILRIRNKKKIILITLVFLIGILSFYSYKSINTVKQSSTITSTNSFDERLKIWENTIDIIKEQPILGVGSGNWQYNFLKYSVSQIDIIVFYNTTFQKPHNDYLWILSELGIIGFTFFLLILFFIFKPVIKSVLKEYNIELSLLLSFIIGLAIISFFSFPKERITHICLTAVLISLLLIRTKSTFQIKHDSIYKYVILITLCFNLVISFFILKGQYFTTLMLQEKQKNNPAKVIEYGEKSLSLFYNTDETSTPISSYIGWASLLINDNSKLNYHTYNAYCISPYDFEVLSNYAVVLLKNKQLTEAKTILLKAYNINPHSEQVLINLFILEYNIGNYEKAYNYLIKIKGYKSDYPMETEKITKKMLSKLK